MEQKKPKAKKVTKENKTEGFFKFLKPSEIDAIIYERTHGTHGPSKCWKEDELMMRRQVIIDLISQGLSTRRVVEEISARWHIVLQTAYVYYNDALKYMSADSEEFKEHNRDRMQERLEGIIEQSLNAHDYKGAVMACSELNKILGLNQTKQEITIKEIKRKFQFGD